MIIEGVLFMNKIDNTNNRNNFNNIYENRKQINDLISKI